MNSKIRIKVGTAEVEFEGTEQYMREEIPSILGMLVEYSEFQSSLDEESSEILPESTDTAKKKLQITTNTIATKLNSNSGADLIIAACAHLCLVKGQDSFKRSNILAEMKLATNFYKQTYSKNLSAALQSLVKAGKILETSVDTYALDSKEKQRLESILSGS
ncbi:hypothetical protein PH586_18760 [Pseudomonas sp. SA3-5]|uniref:Uncharacterized protein n=1 Tax=Pseudomonas aestuarii TaxID=3018340 RepID=A0ABT4XJM1_9PSED|nr:hypothetical protein [Pseudomonas aestuarii]MDA7088426.1 hypothetical protein [Pseudomonas aestuarii]